MSFRKEKKYIFNHDDLLKVKDHLLKVGMQKLYPPRLIKSYYFDNYQLSMHQDSEEGVLPRKKIRIRCYDNLLKFKEETKISSLEGRFKISKSIKKIRSEKDIFEHDLFDHLYGKLRPTLIVNYTRSYFKLNFLRLTFDVNLSYVNLKSNSKVAFKDPKCVMEVKVPINCPEDYIENIIPYSTSRFSKYCRGINFF